MKKMVVSLAVILSALSFCPINAQMPEKEKEFINILKEELGSSKKGELGDINTIREIKRPNQVFCHISNMTINGKGIAVSKRLRGWWNSSAAVNFCHETNMVIIERITSSKEDLNNGIIKSEFKVNKISEHLISAALDYKFSGISTQKMIVPFLENIRKEYGKGIDNTGNFLLSSAAGAFLTPEPTVSKWIAVGSAAAGGILKMIKIGLDWIGTNQKDGYIILPKEIVKKISPDYNAFITKISELDGSRIIAVWECGKGYTSIKIIARNVASEADMKCLAELIYRSNPIVTDKLYPRRIGTTRLIDASEIGGMIFSNAVKMNKVTGLFKIKNRGKTSALNNDLNDVQEILESTGHKTPEINIEEIGIMETGANVIRFIHKGNSKTSKIESLTMQFTPHGAFYILNNKGLPRFIRKAVLEGELTARANNRKGIFQEINMDERDVKIHITYGQTYLGELDASK